MLAMMRPPGLNRCPSCFQISTCATGKRVGNRVADTYRDIGNTVGNSRQHSRQHSRQQSDSRVGKTGNASNNYRSDRALQVNTLDKPCGCANRLLGENHQLQPGMEGCSMQNPAYLAVAGNSATQSGGALMRHMVMALKKPIATGWIAAIEF